MTASQPVNRLALTTYVRDGLGATLIEIDGVDILTLPELTRRDDGTVSPEGPERFLPPDPLQLLPPDSSALLPAAVPRQAMVGICCCGEPGCASLWLQVRRSGNYVLWEPDPRSQRSSIDMSWTFDLREYLDAIDDGQRSTQRWETRARLLARELRQQRDSLFGFWMSDSRQTQLTLLDVLATPGEDLIILRVATDDGVRRLTVPVEDNRSDEQILNSLARVDPADWDY